MNIDERIKYAEQKRDEAFREDSLSGISYWDGYIEAVKAVNEEGYRMASEVAREITKYLAKLVDDKEILMCFGGQSGWFINVDNVRDLIAELNKKYTEEGK
jgi:hypothetical protein